MHLGAIILLPDGFDEHPEARYPVMYNQGHFRSTFSGFREEPPAGTGPASRVPVVAVRVRGGVESRSQLALSRCALEVRELDARGALRHVPQASEEEMPRFPESLGRSALFHLLSQSGQPSAETLSLST